MKRFLSRIFFVLGDVYFGLLAIYFVARFGSKTRFWQVELLSSFLHLLVLGVPILTALYIWKRRWYRLVPASLVMIVLFVLFGNQFVPNLSTHKISSDKEDIVVMAYNVGYGLASHEQLVNTLRLSGADIIGLIEGNPNGFEEIQASLVDDYPYQAVYPLISYRAIFSKYPITEVELINVNWEHLQAYLQVTVDIEGLPTRVIVFRNHPPSFGGQFPRYGYGTWRGGEELMRNLPDDGLPTIILTDMNETDQSLDYRYIRQAGFQDAHREAGWGYGLTFPARPDGWRDLPVPPLVRIDYIFVRGPWEVQQSWRGYPGGSDHFPVLARLNWEE